MKKSIIILLTVLVPIISCKKAEEIKLQVTPQEIAVYSEGTQLITTNVDDATFTSGDEFYASVDATGMVTGNKVGETTINVSSTKGSASVPVKILSQYSLYPDIDFLVGKTLNDITKVLGTAYDHDTTSKGEDMYVFTYPTSYVDFIGFIMSGSRVSSILVAVPTKNTSMLTKHLLERYSVAGMQNDYYFFLNHDKNVVIALTVYSIKYLAAMYVENTSSKSQVELDYSILEDFQRAIQ